MQVRHILLAASTLSLATAAFAGPQCTEAPKSGWLTEEAMKQKIAADGYTVDKFKVTAGNCYEIYGKDKDGQKAEVYFNPVDGSIVKAKQG
ncbi:MAG TPA: PepSY domain-containing protein [Aromatoleum sp.]|uniref:PepSY domain-containing protein n=1 Tax=Aromatoleum sp. TaxID=2307007 RepID=UPI002B49CC9A|nr:PepSY domain-containing protein [Aromatoleum sp.]HJV26221.1 PepSY domain-containing protein [Aromatoleum sp.]